jgi:NAD-dependent dihydropyrimidine dehydrogenase PreA subunit
MNEKPTFWSLMWEHWDLAKTLRSLKIYFEPEKCSGVWQCVAVCPVGCWDRDMGARKAVLSKPQSCVACGACVLQCPEGAIELKK